MTTRRSRKPDTSARLFELLAPASDVVVVRDPDGAVVAANAAFRRLADGRWPAPAAAGARVVSTGPVSVGPDGVRSYEQAVETRDGLRWFEWRETELEGFDRPYRQGVGREITDRVVGERELDDARRKAVAASRAKSRFLATVSHEFRTPLNGVLGMASLLVDTDLSAEQANYVDAIRDSAQAFLSLIEEILDFAKIEAGRIDVAAEPFALEPLVQGVVELLAPRAQGKGCEIACFVAADVPTEVVGDREKLRQILLNLAGNAVKFTAAGGVGLSVQRGAGDAIELTVADTGPGIADAVAVFEEFEQGDDPAAQEGGTGLGLAITRRLVDRLGGEIAVESEPGRGSVFRLRLPLPAGPDAAASGTTGPAKRVLLIGASPFEMPFIARRLMEAGHAVVRVPGPADARRALADGPFDVVVVDAALGEDGREVASEARGRGTARTVVLWSPFERRSFGSHRAAGFDAYLTKPVRARSLAVRLREDAQSREPVVAKPSRPPPRAPMRVLLAEDNEINALVAMKLLGKLGGLVDWAKDGTGALRMAEAARAEGIRYDVVLTDLRMPGLDGFEFVRRLREAEPSGEAPVRVVALTASYMANDDATWRRAGFDDVLMKPFTLDALDAACRPQDVRHATR